MRHIERFGVDRPTWENCSSFGFEDLTRFAVPVDRGLGRLLDVLDGVLT